MTEILTPRLIIRRPELSDLDAIHSAKMAVWPALQNWMSWAYNEAASIESTRGFITDYKTALCGFDRETGEFVISSGCDPTNKESEYATGYWVAEDFLGKGYATESCNAVIRYAFGALGATAMHIEYFEGNAKSRNVIEKLGFEFVRVNPKSHTRCSDGTLLDSFEYVRRDANNLPELDVTWS